MALNKQNLSDALLAAFSKGTQATKPEDWTPQDMANALADAIDAYVRDGEVSGMKVTVTSPQNQTIGTGTQSAPVKLI